MMVLGEKCRCIGVLCLVMSDMCLIVLIRVEVLMMVVMLLVVGKIELILGYLLFSRCDVVRWVLVLKLISLLF